VSGHRRRVGHKRRRSLGDVGKMPIGGKSPAWQPIPMPQRPVRRLHWRTAQRRLVVHEFLKLAGQAIEPGVDLAELFACQDGLPPRRSVVVFA